VTTAAFAQPSGLDTDGTTLFIADSETSSIRAVALADSPTVETLCGGGQLFEFGDRDGRGTEAKLQHCLGVAYHQGHLWIADTYNHNLKQFNRTTGECTTPWREQQAGQWAEPSGLCATSSHLYVADTGHHRVCRVELSSGIMTPVPIALVCTPDAPCP
jgi:sugar lactone lactonase YvrE